MRLKNKIINAILYTILSVLAVIWVIPILILLSISVRTSDGPMLRSILPDQFTLNNYIRLFTETQLVNFGRWYANTLIVAIFTMILSSLFVLMVAYALSRLRFKTRRPMMNLILILGMFPGFMAMIAIYYIIKAAGLTQSLFALVLVYSGGAGLGYYIAKGFFDTIPKSLDEAALIDGATKNDIFWKIILPLSRPIIIYTVLVSFLAPWMDFIFVSVIMRDNYLNYTVALGLWKMLNRDFVFDYFTRFAAGSVLVALPISILFIIMQKFYIEGVTGGSVKG
jgi:arabinogalactan oligomer / maltooligosaccharide transport system permease protein